MKLLNVDGSVFADAPAWLVEMAPTEIGRAFVATKPDIAFIVRPSGLRFYAASDRAAWVSHNLSRRE